MAPRRGASQGHSRGRTASGAASGAEGKAETRKTTAASSKKGERTGRGQGKNKDSVLFKEQLDILGLEIREVTADGNCFFRSLADQLEGCEHNHAGYRKRIVDFIESHRADFEPFVEDDVPFDKYCTEMHEDGTWAGNLEIQAASLVLQRNFCLHRLKSPRWNIVNFPGSSVQTLHLSYHDGEHYNSVRAQGDASAEPAKPVVIEADRVAAVASAGGGSKGEGAAEKAGQGKRGQKGKGKGKRGKEELVSGAAVERVMKETGCWDRQAVEATLVELEGEVEAAIEYIRVGQDAVEESAPKLPDGEAGGVDRGGGGEGSPPSVTSDLVENGTGGGGASTLSSTSNNSREGERGRTLETPSSKSLSSSEGPSALEPGAAASTGGAAAGAAERDEERRSASARGSGTSEESREGAARGKKGEALQREEAGAPTPQARNRPCPCGSRKKFKSCCGVGGLPQRAPPVRVARLSEALSNKERREQLRLLKLAPQSASRARQKPGSTEVEEELDLGSLCI